MITNDVCENVYAQEILAHTEDALQEVLNHFYIVSAHIIEKSPQGKHNVRHSGIIVWT